MSPRDEERELRAAAFQNMNAILAARRRAENELRSAKEALEARSTALNESLAQIRATLESTTDGILVTNRNREVTGYNENFVRMWNLPEEAMVVRDHGVILDHIRNCFPDEQGFLARVEAIERESLDATSDILELINGRVFERFTRVQSVDGKNVGRVWIFRDITERVRAEEALREETRALELINRTGVMLSSQLDLEAVVQSVTDAATQMCGAAFGAFFYNTQDERGDSYLLFTLSGAPREAFEKFGNPRATALFGPTFRGEHTLRSDDILLDPRYGHMSPHHGMPAGHPPVRSYLAVPVISRSTEVIGGLFFGHPEPARFTERNERMIESVAAQAAVAIDNARLYERAQKASRERERLLDSERRARAEVERASALKDDFLATLSHELRTPLNAILGWATILRRPDLPREDVQRGLDTIDRNARIQTQLIEDLLDMSRITSGKVRLEIRPLEPHAVVEAALETVRPVAEARGVRLETIFDPAAGPVSGDPHRLQQVVWNLLSNAIKFTPRGGRVQVLLRRAGSHVEIVVADTGIGIKPQFLPFVFDRFRQADASTTRAHGGLGLGLSIVRSLVELHGGQVSVASTGEGEGTTFTVLLPLCVIQRPEDSGEPAVELFPRRIDPGGFDLAGIRVLVVDDERDGRDLIARVLGDHAATVTTAENATEALEIMEQDRPDVIVSDIGMPGMDGYELIRRVRQLERHLGGHVPAIALTAFARSEDRMRALRAGFLVHVAKPVDPAELIATVASAVGRTDTVPE